MKTITIQVPTFYGTSTAEPPAVLPEFGAPYVPLIVKEEDGIRICLGTSDPTKIDTPDIVVERRPAGWAIFLRPCGGDDECGHVYFLDDGRSLVQRNTWFPSKLVMAMFPEIDDTPERIELLDELNRVSQELAAVASQPSASPVEPARRYLITLESAYGWDDFDYGTLEEAMADFERMKVNCAAEKAKDGISRILTLCLDSWNTDEDGL
jgi:hypothetical protein